MHAGGVLHASATPHASSCSTASSCTLVNVLPISAMSRLRSSTTATSTYM